MMASQRESPPARAIKPSRRSMCDCGAPWACSLLSKGSEIGMPRLPVASFAWVFLPCPPGPHGLPVLVHRQVMQVKDAGLAAVAAAGVEVRRCRRLGHGVGVGRGRHELRLSL